MIDILGGIKTLINKPITVKAWMLGVALVVFLLK